MNHIASLFRRNRRAFFASLLSYLLLAGQVAPLALASASPAARTAASQAVALAGDEAGRSPSERATAAAPAAAPVAAAVFAPTITATKTDTVIAPNGVDPDPDGIADPGQLIEYQITITNNGTDATNVTLNDTVDTNTTLQGGTATSSPLAYSDSYSVVGNVRIQPNAAQGVLANDKDPDTDTNAGMTVTTLAGDNSAPFSGTSANGGQVTSSTTDGAFVYNPAPGFSGSDTFTYTATDSTGKTNSATVTLTVSTPLWFVNASAPAGGDGRLTNPYNCYTGTSVPAVQTCFSDSAPDDPGDFIFLFSGNYTGGYTLLNNESLIGAGATAALAAIAGVTVPAYSDALPATGGAAPVITTTLPAANAVNLAVGSSNLLRGFSVGNTTGAKIASTASGFGTLTVSEVTLGGNGQALNLDSGTLNATFISISSNTSAAQGINLDQMAGSLTSTGGTSITDPATQCILVTASTANLTFNNTSCTLATDGISLQNNSGGTRAFGTLSVTGGSGIGFLHANGGGTTTFGGALTITNPTGNGIDVQNSNVNLSFPATSVDKGTTANTGVNLVNNSARTITFSTLDINTNGGVGLVANNSGALNVTTAAGSEITAANNAAMVLSAGTALGLNFTLVQSTNSTGKGVELNAVTGGIAVATTTITNSTGIGLHALNNTNATAGTFSFGTTSVTQTNTTGVRLEGNAKALSFGSFTVNPDAGQRALHATTNSGTITTTSGAITTTTGIPVEIVGTSAAARTPLSMTLTSVTSNGAANGIILTNTNGPAAAVGFVIVGDGTNNAVGGNSTGGTIANASGSDGAAAGIGIRLENADEVTLRRVTVNGTNQNFGIRGLGLSNITIEFCNFSGLNGTSASADEGTLYFTEITGTNLVKDTLLHGGWEDTVRVINSSGTLTGLTFENCTISQTSVPEGGDAVKFETLGTATMTLTVQNSDITAAKDNPINASTVFGSTMNITVKNNAISNNHTAIVAAGGGNVFASNGVMRLDIDGNTMRDAIGTALLVNASGTAAPAPDEGDIQGYIRNNVIGVAGVANSGSTSASGIQIESNGGGDQDALVVSNNQVFQYNNHGILLTFVDDQGKTANINVTVDGNTVNTPGSATLSTNDFNGFHLNNGATSGPPAPGDDFTTCLDIKNNNFSNSGHGDSTPNNNDLRLRQRIDTTVRLPGYTGANSDTAAVINYLRPPATGVKNNTFTTGNASVDLAGGGGFVNTPGGAPCTQPSFSAEFFDAGAPASDGGLGSLGTPEQSEVTASETSSFGGGVTSAPFVGMPLSTGTAAQTGNTLAPVAQPISNSTAQGSQIGQAEIAPAMPPVISGNNITWNIGTLQQGQSVTITFRVMVKDPYAGGPNVSNQGDITCTECAGVIKTDDPAVGGGADPTLTPINAPPDIVVNNASGPEPLSGSSPMAFTVVLSKPGLTAVTVNFTTAEDTGGTEPATEGVDFTPTSGQLTFAVGQTVQTISVPILHDNDAPEPNETFLVQLTGAVGGNITSGEAVGTITNNNPVGDILISEVRTFGPGGAGDDFVEVYNNTGSPHTVTASDASAGYGLFRLGASCADNPVLVGVIPNGTVIPARGHYLLVGSQYSLSAAASGNLTLTSDLGEGANVGLFKTSSVSNLSTGTRLDAVGFSPNTTGNNCDLLREGGALPPVNPSATGLGQHSFYRSLCSHVGAACTVANPGFPSDRNDNASDFLFVDTGASDAAGAGQQRLGAPGPENMASARVYDQFGSVVLDASQGATAVPNRVRKLCGAAEECDPNRSQFGTLSLRKRITNSTGLTVTQLRVRIVELTTFPRLDPLSADIRPITSADVVVSGVMDPTTCAANGTPATAPCSVTVKGTTVQAPTQALGGGYNTTMVVALPGGGLPSGGSVSLQFLLGIQQTGNFRFLLNVEALP
jgi:hypothetical protein